ncbi:hypothetical protein R1sor_014475 [Riccia sorocarpa]|uniref:Uncharacterized protein n=1 Tax=Riccia sorocarpa TaxID=122646 RepID=A0ABD3HDS0_9MARC
MTKTAIEAARHIQQWGRHDEGESPRAASDRRGEVQSRSRPAIRDILRHRFIQFSMTAIQDFSMQLRTNRACTPMPQPVDPEVFRRALEILDISALITPLTSVPASLAVPPPDLARHAQPEPEVEPEVVPEVVPVVDPVVDPVVELEVEHIMEPTVSMESHHPSTEVHGVVGESIMVVERYVAPHRDDGRAPSEQPPSQGEQPDRRERHMTHSTSASDLCTTPSTAGGGRPPTHPSKSSGKAGASGSMTSGGRTAGVTTGAASGGSTSQTSIPVTTLAPIPSIPAAPATVGRGSIGRGSRGGPS